MINYEQVRALLEKERAELLDRVQVPIETARGDDADLSVMSENKGRVLWLAQDAEAQLAALEKALDRIDNRTYGLCMNCGKLIPEERLAAIPLALYDVSCQAKLEKKLRR